MHYPLRVRSLLGLGACCVTLFACDAERLFGSGSRPPLLSPDSASGVDLGVLEGYAFTEPMAIDNGGRVVGTMRTAGDNPSSQAFVWSNGTMMELPARADGYNSQAQVVATGGFIGGITSDATGQYNVVWDANGRHPQPASRFGAGSARVMAINGSDVLALATYGLTESHALLYRNGAEIDVGYFGQSLSGVKETYPEAMNARGQIVGGSYLRMSGSHPEALHPFLWDNGVMRDVGVLADPACAEPDNSGCAWGIATDINEAGDVIGASVASNGVIRPFLWHGGAIQELAAGSPTDLGVAQFINDAAQVAGVVVPADGTPMRAWRWQSGTATDLGSLGGGSTRITAMNGRGAIVGASLTASGTWHAFYWIDGTMVDLGTGGIADGQSSAVAINARGDVIGWASSEPGDSPHPQHGLLWRAQ